VRQHSGAITCAVLFALCVVTRLPFTSKLLFNMDSVQFVLGMRHFDVALHQPQPPGYFLYVLMGRAMSHLISDPNRALIAVSILFSGLTVVMLYVLATEFYGKSAGLSAALIGISSPIIWFHGEVALSYIPEAFMSLLIAWLCIKAIRTGDVMYAVAASVALGIAGGIRQNTMVFLMPIWLYSVSRLGIRKAALSGAVFCVTVLAWFVPMLNETGGYARYSSALRAHWLDANWRGIHLHWIEFDAKYMTFFILGGLFMASVPLIMSALDVLNKRRRKEIDGDRALFFTFWLLPAFLFHLIIFTHPAVPGHALIYVVGLIVLSGSAIETTASRLAAASTRLTPKGVRGVLLSLVIIADAMCFLFVPSQLSAKIIEAHDGLLSRYISVVRADFSPKDTVLIGSDRFLFGSRHAMYYLPDFIVYDTVVHTTPEGPRIMWGKCLDTHFTRYISPPPGVKNFVDFINYSDKDRPAFPAGAQVIDIGGGLLVYYHDLKELAGVKRIAPVLPPGTDGDTQSLPEAAPNRDLK
jgi:Dolichyl-phosphate-mannose-protein mannosyltransferase